jgi:hypothetical protein
MKQLIYKIFVTVCLLTALLFSCIEDTVVPVEHVTNANVPVLSDIHSVVTTASSIKIEGNVTEHKGYPVTERGICWGTTQTLSIENNPHKAQTDNNDAISLTADDLKSATLYYFCLYAKNNAGTGYSNWDSIRTNSGLGAVETFIVKDNTRATKAMAGGRITNRGEGAIQERGIIYYLKDDMTKRDSILSTMAQDSFTCVLSNLTPSKVYVVQAYVKNTFGLFKGDTLHFETGSGLPVVSDVSIETIKSNYAEVKAEVLSVGDTSLIKRGFCWKRTSTPIPSPNINDDMLTVTFSNEGDGTMTARLQSLIPNQDYYVCAFAENEYGITYSTPQHFRTSSNIPTVTTLGSPLIQEMSVILSGIVTDIGESNVHTVGICYSTSSNPTTLSPKVEFSVTLFDHDVPYPFSTGEITGLKGETIYHYRAYAINGNGTPAYGTDYTFQTPPIFTLEAESFTDGRRIEGSPAYFVINERGYLLGGDIGPNYVNRLWCYNPILDNRKWGDLNAYPAGNMELMATAVFSDSRVYVLGGLGSGLVEKDDFYMYDVVSNWWVSKTTGPPPAYSRTGFSLYSEVVYVGGIKDTAKNEVWAYNVNTDIWTQKADFPVSQYGGIAFNIQNNIYAGLGRNTANVGNKQLWKSNGALTAWIPESSGSILTGNIIAGTVYDNKIYVIDKISNTKYTIFEYDPATGNWKQKADLPNYYWEISFMYTLHNRIYIGFANSDKVVIYHPLWDI